MLHYTESRAEPLPAPVRAAGDYFTVATASGDFTEVYIRGVNLSAAMPGYRPWEQSEDPALYRRWIGQIAAMNANAIRVLDVMPAAFYRELDGYNRSNPDRTVWLFQGIWLELPGDGLLYSPAQRGIWEPALERAVAAVYGQLDNQPVDLSPWLMGYIIGQEWSPEFVLRVNAAYPQATAYSGTFVSAPGCSPMEAWLAELCDRTQTAEARLAAQLHPVSFANWAPLDPIDHRRGFEDALGGLPVGVAEANTDFAENDAASITVNSLRATPDNTAGIFASYHVYPYYPDFIVNQPQYARVYDRHGPNSFLGYLKDLKRQYEGLPLVISEYGLASSPFAVHRHPWGWHHGGMTEAQVADELPRLARAVRTADCAGGMVFSWCDEWFKRVWLWDRLYYPPEESCMWFNPVDPEQNFGLLAVRPGAGRPLCTLTGTDAEWDAAATVAVADVESGITAVRLMHDEGNLYIRVDLDPGTASNLAGQRLLLGLDVYRGDLGNTAFPWPLELAAPAGMEIMLQLQGGELRLLQSSNFRYWRVLSDWLDGADARPGPLDLQDSPMGWIQPRFESNSPTLDSAGQLQPAQSWPINPLPGSPGAEARAAPEAMWNWLPGSGFVEFRLPWILAGYCAPHRRLVLDFDENSRPVGRETEGIAVYTVLSDAAGAVMASLPAPDPAGRIPPAQRYLWAAWEAGDIEFHEYLKPAYYSLQQEFLTEQQ